MLDSYFPKALCEMQTASFRFWTQVTKFTSNADNHYATRNNKIRVIITNLIYHFKKIIDLYLFMGDIVI